MKKKNRMRVKALLVSAMLAGTCCCSVNPSRLGKKEAAEFVENLRYVEDKKTGVCFAVIASRKSMDADSSGLAMTEVPCEKVRMYLE